MADFNDFDLEVQNESDSTIEQFTGSVTTAGSAVVITPSNSRPIKSFFIDVPSVIDPVAPNSILDAIKYSTDGGTTYFTIMSGEWLYMPTEAGITNLYIDSNANGTTYQIAVWS